MQVRVGLSGPALGMCGQCCTAVAHSACFGEVVQ